MQNRFSIRLGWIAGILALLSVASIPMSASGQRVSVARAKKAALASYPGEIVSSRLTQRNGRSVYDIYIRSGEVDRHVLVNARNGRLLPQNTGPLTHNPRRIALAAHPGKVVAGPTRTIYQGKPVYSVTVQSGIVRRTVLVNTQAGSIVKTMIRHTD